MPGLQTGLGLGLRSVQADLDPTRLTAATFAALGLVPTREGAVLGRRAPGGPGNYVRRETNDPEFDFVDVEGKFYPSYLSRNVAVPYLSYSADLAQSPWVKNGCSAALALGGLEHGADWRGPELAGMAVAGEFSGQPGAPIAEVDGDFFILHRNAGSTINTQVTVGVTVGSFYLVDLTIDPDPIETGNGASIRNGGAQMFTATDDVSFIYQATAASFRVLAIIGESVRVRVNSLREVDVHSRVTGAGTITRGEARDATNRNTRWKIAAPATNASDLLISHGKPTGANMTSNGTYDSNIVGWSSYRSSVLTWQAGELRIEGGGTSAPAAEQVVSGFVVGNWYVATVEKGTLNNNVSSINVSIVDSESTLVSANGATRPRLIFQATEEDLTYRIAGNSGGTPGNYIQVDNALIYSLEEVAIPAGTFKDVELGEYTGFAPVFMLRVTDPDDVALHYDVQHVESGVGTPVPNFVPQGATPAAVGAAKSLATHAVEIDAIDVSILFWFAPSTPGGSKTIFAVYKESANRWQFYHHGGGSLTVNTKLDNVDNTKSFLPYSGSPRVMLTDIGHADTDIQIEVDGEVDGDSGSYVALPADMVLVELGSFAGGQQAQYPIVAVRDNNGRLFQQIESYGPDLWGEMVVGELGTEAVVADGDGYILTRSTSSDNQSYFTYTNSTPGYFHVVFDVDDDAGEAGNRVSIRDGTSHASGLLEDQHVDTVVYVEGNLSIRCSNDGHSAKVSNVSVRRVHYKQGAGVNLEAIERYEASL